VVISSVCAYCGNVSFTAAWAAIDTVTDALYDLEEAVIRLPTVTESEETARRMFEKYPLPGFAYSVDRMFVCFDGAPRGIPVGPGFPNQQNFFTRKVFYGINTCVVANDCKLPSTMIGMVLPMMPVCGAIAGGNMRLKAGKTWQGTRHILSPMS
jgi:hypothetical protein